MKQCAGILLLMIFAVQLRAQVFGGNPPDRWAQINTDTVRVIFPRGLDSIGQRVATVAKYLQRDSGFLHTHRKVNIVLQNNATISNAYVALAPFRSEFFLTPPQNPFELGSMGWADNLIVHEWRHIQQYNYFNRGLARIASIFLGQEGRALFNAMAIPDWFFEGDAVWNETKFTEQGRGRLPLAFSGYKSLHLEGRNYSYMKLRNGSLKDFVPNHYDLGYLLVAYGAEKYGSDFWTKVTGDAAAFKPLVYPLQGAIKRHAGIGFRQFVREALDYYQQQWNTEAASSSPEWLSRDYSHQANYLFPYADNQGNIIALKQTTRHIPTFVRVAADGSEQRIATQDITLDNYFSFRNNRIVYAMYNPDARWGNRQFSNIVTIDLESGARKKLTAKSKYFSPDITADGQQIVAVEMLPSGTSQLVVMDVAGNRILEIPAGAGEVMSHPKFAANDNAVFVPVRNGSGLMALRKYVLRKEVSQADLFPFGNYVIGFPVVSGDTVTFTATNKITDDVFAWVEGESKLYHVASHPTGLYQSVLRDGSLVSSVFTSSGYRLGRVSTTWRQVATPSPVTDLYVHKALNETLSINRLPEERYSRSKYSTLSHPFNFHSWRPFYDPPEYSFTIYGQNVLNTVATQLAYTFNENERSHSASGSLVYGGTFLQPFAGISQTWNRSFAFSLDTVARWNEFEWMAGLRLPLQLTGGKMFRFFNTSISYHSKNISFTGANKELFRANDVQYLQSRMVFSSQIQQASQHIYPRFAFTSLLQMRAATNLHARQFLAAGNLFLPGLARTHSIVLTAAYQGRDTMRQYAFTNNFPFSRGYYGGVDFPRMWRVGGNYHFPLLHPDWGLANLVYFQRIRANAFTDYSQVQSLRTGAVFGFQSVGAELFFDTRWWNQVPVSFGVRYSRLMNGALLGLAPNQWELILPVDLIR